MAASFVLCACEVHGLVGSNASDGLKGDRDPSDPDVSTTTGSDPHGGTTAPGGAHDGDGDDDHGAATGPVWFDVAAVDGPEACLAPLPVSCDDRSNDPWHAMGIGCRQSEQVKTEYIGHPDAIGVHRGLLGTYGEYEPKEGERMAILSTGRAADLPRTHQELGCEPEVCPSTELTVGIPLTSLPEPIDVRRVHKVDTCQQEPDLVGTGDCSNSLEQEWMAGQGAVDYAEMRMRAVVPPGADAFIYRFAFFSAEYPNWNEGESPWNDMYVAWLESEAWTGNVSFDDQGNPITIGGVFLDYLDADSPQCSEVPCVAPELDGFAMDGHAGTQWLETVAPVIEGEEIEMVFAIFDMTDGLFDTAVILDGAQWGCTDKPPLTTPAG